MPARLYSIQGAANGSTRSISLQDLPPSAWSYIAGHPEESEDHSPQQLYGVCPWLFRAANLRAQALSDMPWSLSAGTREISSWDEYAPIPEAPWIGRLTSLLYRTELALFLSGSAYWLRTGNKLGTRTLDYRWLLPTSVTPTTTVDAGLTGFSRTVGGRVLQLDLEDIVYFWLPSVTTEVGPGSSPAHAALAAAGIIRNIDLYADAFFHRGALSPTILTVEGNAPQTELDRLERWWKRVAAGVRRAWETVAVRQNIKVNTLGAPPKELAMPELTAAKQKDISVAAGIPFTLLFSEASNRAVAQEDNINFMTKCVLPEAQLVAEILNDQIFTPLGMTFAFHGEKTDVIKQYHEGLAFQRLALYEGGVISREELRRDLAMPEQPEGTTFASSSAPIPISDLQGDRGSSGRLSGGETAAATAAHAGDITTSKRLALLPPAKAKGPTLPHLDGADAERAKLEAAHAPRVRKALAGQLSHALPPHTSPATVHGAEQRAKDANGPLRSALLSLLTDGATLGADVGRAQVEALWGVGRKATVLDPATSTDDAPTATIGVDWTLVSSDALAWASQYAYELVGQIDETTVKVLQQALPAYIDGTIDYAELVSQIADAFGLARAELIATTEITRSFAMGATQAWQASGVITQRRFNTANDEHVCPICGPLNGQVFPLDSGPEIAVHPRCRCFWAPVAADIPAKALVIAALAAGQAVARREPERVVVERHAPLDGRKTVERDAAGKIVAVVERHVPLVVRKEVERDGDGKITAVVERYGPPTGEGD